MADLIFKLRVLRWLLVGTYQEWRRDVWRRELDERYCCDGHMCGCGGWTIRRMYNPPADTREGE